MRSSLRRMLDAGIRIVFPEVCAECGISGSWICSDCWPLVQPVDPMSCCVRCGNPLTPGDRCSRCDGWSTSAPVVRAAFTYDGPVRRSIVQMKYHGQYARAAWHAGHLAEVVDRFHLGAFDVIAPVPLHPAKHRKRGYNQSEHLARHLAEKLALPVEQVVVRVRNTPSQTELGRRERWTNVQGAFESCADLTGRRVLLVDDVVTTGSTIRATAAACAAGNASEVVAITVATGV